MRKRIKFASAAIAAALLLQLFLTFATAFAGFYESELQQSSHVSSGQEFYPIKVINDFNTPADVATWQAGVNSKSVNYAATIANAPLIPFEGAGCLEQVPENVKVYEWRTISRDFTEPLDLSGQHYLAFAANSWGWQPDGYFMKIRLHSGASVFESVAKITYDRWNHIFIDISSWEKRGAITKMEISFMQNFDLEGVAPGAPGYNYWDGRFQLDYIIATNTLDMRFSRDGDSEGFTAHQGSLAVAGGKANFAIEGAGAYIASPDLMIDASSMNGLKVSMDNLTSASKLKVAWITESDTSWNDVKSKEFNVVPNGTSQSIDINMSDMAGWSGTIKQFRIFAPAESGSFAIDDIRFKKFPPIYSGKITTSAINDSLGITIAGIVNAEYVKQHANDDLVLFELPTYADPANLSGLTPLDEQDMAAKFSFDISLKDGDHNRLYSKFAVAFRNNAGGLTLADAPHYITNAEKLAPNQEPFPKAKSIKGLQVQMTDDAEDLGVSHAAINVRYDTMLYLANSNPDNTIRYVVDGETFFFKKSTVLSLDSQIKSLSDNGTIISLILIMNRDLRADTPNKYLIHPDSQPGARVRLEHAERDRCQIRQSRYRVSGREVFTAR